MAATEPRSSWSARDWAQAIVPYRRASAVRGAFELAVTFPPFVAIWTAMLIASHHGQFWLSFALAPLAAGLLIRLFIIQHDCGHGSFFPSKLANDWVGRALGVLTVTPYDHWRRFHAIHHATSAISTGAGSATSRRSRCANISPATGATVFATGSIAIRR